MQWRELERFEDGTIAKLDHLRRAARADLRIPPTRWTHARDVPPSGPVPEPPFPGPWMVRSASPEEDGSEGSSAGRFHSELVDADAGGPEVADAARRVAASLTVDERGEPRGAVFVQPFVHATRAGVAFFDGFHYERTFTAGDNRALTAGEERGTVERGELARGEPWSHWLTRVAATYPAIDRLDLEWAEDEDGFVLLQARRALFAVRRDPLVSVANHREILGPAPSPWIVSALDEAGRSAFDGFAACDPEIGQWGERYAQIAAGRAWMDFSAFFRVMDHWGLPRTFVTEGVGGASDGALDHRFLWRRFLRSAWPLVRLQYANVKRVLGMFADLRRLEREVHVADDLRALHAATASGLATALSVNIALGGVLAGVQRLRRALGSKAGARVVTGEMGREYEALRRLPSPERGAGLDRWLERFGHRGPLESDPMHPRFAELRETLAIDLEQGPANEAQRNVRAGRGPLFWFERRRELFRDELMKHWSELRRRLLDEGERLVRAGELARVDDVFFLSRADLTAPSLQAAAAASREAWERTRTLALPTTARLSKVREAESTPQRAREASTLTGWRGIGLGGEAIVGQVRRADDLAALLGNGAAQLGREDVLLVPALEPAWGVLFGRVGAVVAELGGELSHASILLRELGTPAVVNCLGAWDGLREGDTVRVDPESGAVQRLQTAQRPALVHEAE